ncbi:hypothetical protein TWF281_003501 [Arthrobotrys megalospora]
MQMHTDAQSVVDGTETAVIGIIRIYLGALARSLSLRREQEARRGELDWTGMEQKEGPPGRQL